MALFLSIHANAFRGSARGFETFVVELRGCGMTKRPPNGRQYRHTFDDEVMNDIPALIAKAKEVSGSPKVMLSRKVP